MTQEEEAVGVDATPFVFSFYPPVVSVESAFSLSLPPPSAAEPFLCKPGLLIKQEGGGEGKSLEEGRGKGPSWFNKGINQPPFPSSLSLLPSPLSRP